MRAVVIEKFNVLPTVQNVADPTPSPSGVVVEVKATGVCRSDWHGWVGHEPGIELPHVPGHELAGVVSAVGRDVKNWRVGDRVTVPFAIGCGHCLECHTGHHHICEQPHYPGFNAWGSFAEYVALDFADTNLVRLPEDMAFTTAAGLGCRFVTSFRAVVDQAATKLGEWVVVHGCGGVGLSAIMIAASLGAEVIAVDVTDEKLAFARSMGARHVVKAGKDVDVAAAIFEITNGGAHVSIDALGHSTTALNSVLSLRRRGRHVQVGLMLAEHARAPMPMDRVIAYELEIKGSHGMQAFRYGEMMRMISSGLLKPEKLVGKRITLDEAPAALVAMDRFEGTGISVIEL